MSHNTIAEKTLQLTEYWKENPRKYLTECLGVKLIWKLQLDLIDSLSRAIKEHKPIYIASGHALGKDFICSCIANWFLDCFIPSKVILTAPSDRQVKKIMWAETLARFNNKKIKLWGKPYTDPYIEIRREDWFLLGFATKDTGAAAESGGGKFQGLRAATNMCVIVTEAQAVEDSIFDQIDAVSTAENSLRIFIGNPTRAKGAFAKMLRDKQNNIVFHFSCLENPNYLQRKIVVPGLATYDWVEDKRRKWGESDPRWVGRVLGQIPDNALSNTFNQSWINHTKERRGLLAGYSVDAGVSVDSAGEGVDDNVIMAGKGGEVMETFTRTIMTPTEVAHKAVEMCKKIRGSFIIFDCDGLGIRDYQECNNLPEEYLRGIEILKFHGSGQSTFFEELPDGRKRPMYANLRAEASFITQERGLAGKCSMDEKDQELIEDLMEEEYYENKQGLIQIEPKEDLKERLERSPGRGDCYKMLQWAFSQNIQDHTYADRGNPMPQYGKMDNDVYHGGQQLPRYGKME